MALTRTYTVDYTDGADKIGVDSTSTGGIKKIDADLTLAYAHLTSLQKNYTSASAPSGSVVGQVYHDTDVDRLLIKNNAGNWVGVGDCLIVVTITATDATWNVPDILTGGGSALVICVGSGGGGGGSHTVASNFGASGGSGGQVKSDYIDLTSVATVAVTIGAAGAAGAAGSAGGAGASTTFGAYITALGGLGGNKATAAAHGVGVLGGGFPGYTTGTIGGQTVSVGNLMGLLSASEINFVGGCSLAGGVTTAHGLPTPRALGGIPGAAADCGGGGGASWGAGGAGGTTDVAGTDAAANTGAGGGGAGENVTGTKAGGAGGSGLVKVIYWG